MEWVQSAAFSPSTVSRRVHRYLEGIPLRDPGRPRDEQAPRRANRLTRRLEQTKAELANVLEAQSKSEQERQRACQRQILGLIFNGNSLRGAAECAHLGFPDIAPQKSTIGQQLSSACEVAKELYEKYFSSQALDKLIVAVCDEIYISGKAILEIIEPRSLAIVGLGINGLTKDNWSQLLKEVCGKAVGGVSDQGLSVSSALSEAVLSWYDIWHLLRTFASLVGRLEEGAYYWIQQEQQALDEFLASLPFPPGKRVPLSLKRLEEVQEKGRKSIEIYDQASTVLGFLYEAARPIDTNGRLKAKERMQEDWEATLDLTSHIKAPTLWPLADKLRDKIDGKIAQVLEPLLKNVKLPTGWNESERESLQRLTCQVWLYHHQRQTHLSQAPAMAAQWVALQLGISFVSQNLEKYCGTIFELLDRVPVASSAVECVNSIIRLRQGGKRHPHPHFIYLLAWLHNTRRFLEGRRKGLTPAELLGVQLPQDGWTMLLDAIAAQAALRN